MQKNIKNNWFIVLNPAAANGKVKMKWPEIQTLLAKYDLAYDVAETTAPKHAIDLTKNAIENGYRKIIAIGGDGTNNEVVNGIMLQNAVDSKDVIYALLPLGTGNDWIKQYKISKNLEKRIQACKAMNTTLQDVGVVTYFNDKMPGKRYFANVAGMAYDAFLCEEAELQKANISNQMLYLFLVFKCLFKYKLKRARILFDDQKVEDYFHIINVGICKYSGGGMQLVPHAIPNDGKLALTICREVSKFGVILNTPRFYSGTLDRHPQITIHQVKNLRVEGLDGEETLVEVDGEFLGHTPAEYSIVDNALQLIVPEKLRE